MNRFISISSLYWILGIGLGLALLWVTFFDSHNLVKRWQWQAEYSDLQEENRQLQSQIDEMESQLEQPVPDSVIERIAREEYGMRKPGETVYRIEP